MGFFEKRRKRKLYQQWVDKSGLPPESIPRELEPGSEDVEGEDDYEGSVEAPPRRRNVWIVHLTMRHLLILLYIIAALLVLSTTLIVVLIMSSC